MGMNVGSGRSADPEVMMDINTTPLIDVMLVLLVMLIITIPIQLHAVNLSMPTGNPPPPLAPPEVLKVDVDGDGRIWWNGEIVPDRDALEARISDAAAKPVQPELHSAPGQEREVRDRRRGDGILAAAGPHQDRHWSAASSSSTSSRERHQSQAPGVKARWITHGNKETRSDMRSGSLSSYCCTCS